MTHGTRYAYDRPRNPSRRCRCDDCRAGNAARVRRQRAARLAAGRLTHGTRSAYDSGCRCDDCRARRARAYTDLDENRRRLPRECAA